MHVDNRRRECSVHNSVLHSLREFRVIDDHSALFIHCDFADLPAGGFPEVSLISRLLPGAQNIIRVFQVTVARSTALTSVRQGP